MKNTPILIIDHQSYWRDYYAECLRENSFSSVSVEVTDDYKLFDPAYLTGFGLVILSCTIIGAPELELVKHLILEKKKVIVFQSFRSTQFVHTLFRMGVFDILPRPYDLEQFVQIVIESVRADLPHSVKHIAVAETT